MITVVSYILVGMLAGSHDVGISTSPNALVPPQPEQVSGTTGQRLMTGSIEVIARSGIIPDQSVHTALEAIASRNGEDGNGTLEKGERISETFGDFYKTYLLTQLRTDMSQLEKHQVIQERLGMLPPQLKTIYGKAMGALDGQLAHDKASLEASGAQTDAEKIWFLLSSALAEDDSAEVKDDIGDVTADDLGMHDMVFLEPSDGMFIIEIGETARNQMEACGLLKGDEGAMYVPPQQHYPIGFIMLQQSYDNDPYTTRDRILLHEVHHFYRDHLVRAGYMIGTSEPDPEMARGFESIADEIAGYLLSDDGLRHVSTRNLLPPDISHEVLPRANRTHQIMSLAIELRKAEGGDISPFLEATQHSRNFSELEANAVAHVPQTLTEASLRTIFDNLYLQQVDESIISAVLSRREHAFSMDVLRSFTEDMLGETESAYKLLGHIVELQDFFRTIHEPETPVNDYGLARLRSTVALPDETLACLPTLYRSNRSFIDHVVPYFSSEETPVQLMLSSLNMYTIEQPGMIESWQTFLGTSAVLQTAFAEVKPLIIAREQEKYAQFKANNPEGDLSYLKAVLQTRIELLNQLSEAGAETKHTA